MTKQPTVKILIGYHKPSILFKSDILTPIHLGRALVKQPSKDGVLTDKEYQWMLDNMIGDDTGDNISEKNRHYNEMTGIYWAWKNYDKLGNPDYFGFFHYRRLFSFTDAPLSPKDSLEDLIQKTQILNDDVVIDKIRNYDVLTSEMVPANSFCPDIPLAQKMEMYPLNRLFKVVREQFPNWDPILDAFGKNDKTIYGNMFIMKRELFFEYCEFCFKILQEYEKILDYKSDNPRRIGFDSEFVTALFLYNQILKGNCGILKKDYYNDILINYTYKDVADVICYDTRLNKMTTLHPAFSQNNIPIILACDNNYAPYGAITINSIIQNATPENNYDIILLHTEITQKNQDRIYQLAKGKNNISVRILDISEYLMDIKKDLFVHNFYSIATYFRILIPQICALYHKVIYLDTDMVVCTDIAELYNVDISGNLLAASPDFAAICQANLGKSMPDRPLTYNNYFKEVLGIKNINQYFQAGALIINVSRFKSENIYQQFIDKIKEIKNPFYVDQDILNSICYGKVKFFNAEWNHVTHIKSCNYFKGFIPEKYFQQYVRARENPKLIHYTGPEKPWHNPKWVLADYFWKYAINTPFTETLMFNVVNGYLQSYVNKDNWTIDMDTFVYTHLYGQKQRRNRILSFIKKLTFGKIKQRLTDKLKIYNKRLQKAEFLIKKEMDFYKTPPEISDEKLISGSGLFDCNYYAQEYHIKPTKAIKHYCRKGWLKGYNPSFVFNTKEYMNLNNCKNNPLVDYIKKGKQLGNYVCTTAKHQASEEDINKYWKGNSIKRKKQVVYTCLTGDYDSLINHKYINSDWSYICFTDNKKLLKQKYYGIWKIYPLVCKDFDDTLNNRYHKLFPHKLFSEEVEKSIYVDANCNILTSYLFEIVAESALPLLIPIHFSTPCLYQEMDWYDRHNPQFYEKSKELRNRFLNEGFPVNYGMNENNIIYREHADARTKKIMELWWKMLIDYVPRDQLSLSYCLWKYNIKPEEISITNARIDLKNFVFYPHKKGK